MTNLVEPAVATSVPNAQLTHVGIPARNLDVLVEFYGRVMGMVVTDRGHFLGRDLAFLSRSPDEHHQIVMIYDPASVSRESALGQLSFRLDDLEALRRYHALLLKEEGVVGLEGRNHGNSWSLYFFDPEGNKIELYVPTPWHVSQPWRAPLDLTRPADSIVDETRQLMAGNPTSRPMDEWSRELKAKLGR
ncbi:hypothetical protein BH09PSE5_BH09PSE5_49050 [soil metagenome]